MEWGNIKRKKVALITVAACGCGESIARMFIKDGAKVCDDLGPLKWYFCPLQYD